MSKMQCQPDWTNSYRRTYVLHINKLNANLIICQNVSTYITLRNTK